jgi:hypothetical protein
MNATSAASIVFLDRASNQPVITKIVSPQTSFRFVFMMMMRYCKVINIYQRTLVRILGHDSMACVTLLGRDSRLSVLDDDDATLKAVCFDATKSTIKSLPKWNTTAAPSHQAFQLGVIHTMMHD